jgi:diguanylate cyclase (GGDEF)-like protein
MPAIIVGLIVFVGIITVIDFVADRYTDSRGDKYATTITDGIQFQAALVEAGSGVRGYLLTGRAEDLVPYQLALQTLDAISPPILPELDDPHGGRGASPAAAAASYATISNAWSSAVHLEDLGNRPAAIAALFAPNVEAARNSLRHKIAVYITQAQRTADRWHDKRNAISLTYQVMNLAAVVIAVLAMIYVFGRITMMITTGFAAREQTEQLFAMADTLQSASGQEDTNQVLQATAAKLLPGLGGALYVFNNSRDRLDLSTRWGAESEPSASHIAPASCWALKRGKPHFNLGDIGALRCAHSVDEHVTLEIPMAARGELYGLLEISVDPKLVNGAARLQAIQPVAAALGDAMSLALSSLALRERLRNQALRDALTGLYNRRFLEEMLERLCREAERRRAPITAIMIDLDHFKRLNDQHGHSAGDAVLKDVGSAILSCLRSTDVACRYGGEELVVLLPDCSLSLASGKAEQIRARIAELTQEGGLQVTASLGVGSMPETCANAGEILPNADAALYRAKQLGRNRVELAAVRPGAHLSLINSDRAPVDGQA